MKIAHRFDPLRTLLFGLAVVPWLPAVAVPCAAQSKPSAEKAFHQGEESYYRQSYAEALRWYRMAADQGNTQAQAHIGNLYAEGQGVAQDYGEALRWYRLAAEHGDQEAQNNVGFFLSGWGVPQDSGEALRWLRKAADQGNEVTEHRDNVPARLGRGAE